MVEMLFIEFVLWILEVGHFFKAMTKQILWVCWRTNGHPIRPKKLDNSWKWIAKWSNRPEISHSRWRTWPRIFESLFVEEILVFVQKHLWKTRKRWWPKGMGVARIPNRNNVYRVLTCLRHSLEHCSNPFLIVFIVDFTKNLISFWFELAWVNQKTPNKCEWCKSKQKCTWLERENRPNSDKNAKDGGFLSVIVLESGNAFMNQRAKPKLYSHFLNKFWKHNKNIIAVLFFEWMILVKCVKRSNLPRNQDSSLDPRVPGQKLIYHSTQTVLWLWIDSWVFGVR